MACTVKINRHGYFAFRLYWNGIESWEGTGLKDTPKNRERMEARAVLISEEIEREKFDYLKWFPDGNKANLFKAAMGKTDEGKADPKTIRQYYKDWIKDKNPPIVKKSRGRKYRSHFTVHILPLHGDKWMHLYGMTEIREMLADLTQRKHLTVKTAKNVMNATLRAFFRDAVAEKVIEKNPFDELPKKWWPKTVTPEPDPFTEEERDRIIAYFFEKYWKNGPTLVYLFICSFGLASAPLRQQIGDTRITTFARAISLLHQAEPKGNRVRLRRRKANGRSRYCRQSVSTWTKSDRCM